MDQPTVLRTAKVGGFVKEDVLTYVDELNSKIYGLGEELKEVREKASAPAQDSAQIQKLETSELRMQVCERHRKSWIRHPRVPATMHR